MEHDPNNGRAGFGHRSAGSVARLVLMAVAVIVEALTCTTAQAASPALAAGSDFSLAVSEAGRLLGWGKPVAVGAKQPVRVQGLPAVARIFAGDSNSFAIDRQGGLWAWGYNQQGGLGDGSTIMRALPVQIGNDFSQVSGNVNHTLAIKTDGTLWAWGNGSENVFGNGTQRFETAPVLVGSGFASVAAGYTHGVALRVDGSVWTWGRNDVGQLGVGTSEFESPVPVPVGMTAKAVAAGYSHSLALMSNGDLWAWGLNDWGQVGDGSFRVANLPKRIGRGFMSVAAHGNSSVAVKTDGSLWIWGAVSSSADKSSAYSTPTKVDGNYASAAAGFEHVLLLRVDGGLSSMGGNLFGQLGDGSTTFRASPVSVTNTSYVSVSAGAFHSLALRSDGTVFGWGDDSEGQLGNGPTNAVATPVALGSDFQAVAVGRNHRLALKTDGTLMAWGYRGPAMGLGVVGPKDTPQPVGTSYAEVVAGEVHTLALKRNGTLWGWGSNSRGQLGIGGSVQWTPTQLGQSRDRYTAVAAGWSHSLAIKTDGSLWAWGANEYGQLGVGDEVSRFEPVKVGDGYRSASAGAYHTLAVKTDGTLWGWGGNGSGQLGLGHFTDQLVPTFIGSGYSKVVSGGYHALALKSDGTLWAWGRNDDYQLGNGSAKSSAVPVLIGRDFADIGAGPTVEHSMALRRDGTVWVWGSNVSGQLGDGSFASAPKPINLVNEGATGALVLTTAGNAGSTSERLTFLMQLIKKGYDLKAVLSDLRANGLQGEVYFSALLPKNLPGVTCTNDCPRTGSGAGAPDNNRLRALRAQLGPLADSAGSGTGMVAGVISRGGFKQTGGAGYGQADQAYTGDLGRVGTLDVLGGVGDVLTGTSSVICMGVATPDMTAKGQVLMRPIATGSGVQGVVQCPPVQTSATAAQFQAEASGPITARTITAVVNPRPEDRGRTLKVFAWAVAPDGRQYMQTSPGTWAEMVEPMQHTAEVTLPASGPYRLEVTRGLDLSGLVGTLVFIGFGQSWEEVRNLNRAGQSYVVQ